MRAVRISRTSTTSTPFTPSSLRTTSFSQLNQTRASFAQKRYYAQAEADTASSSDLTFTFACPHVTLFKDSKVKGVVVPGADGYFGILPKHVPTIAQLVPGVVSVKTNKGEEKFFVSGGFAFVHKDSSASVSAVEAVPLDQLDADAAKEGYRKSMEDISRAGSNKAEEAKARIAAEAYKSILAALGTNV